MTTQSSNPLIRHLHPASVSEPWAREFAEAIEVPVNARQLVLSGVGPQVVDDAAPAGSVQAYGDTAVQTLSVIRQIEATLTRHGYGLGDIVSMQALLVADPAADGVADFEGFSAIYNQYFGTPAQPNVPTRTRAQVIRLVPPGWLVEMTVTAIKASN
ncbi:RidA family protein [Pseudomonas sp. G.S.17]|uniref:RidA family protein n=1 Tax=Pseudomonas sp. G.S.17 TaxID=3137451 RepID=UPI00311CB811